MALQQPNVTSGDLIARSRIYLRKFNHQICELQSREVPRHLFDGCVQGASFVARGLSGLSTVVGIEVPYTIMHTPIYHRIISYHIVYHRIPSYTIHSKIGEFTPITSSSGQRTLNGPKMDGSPDLIGVNSVVSRNQRVY